MESSQQASVLQNREFSTFLRSTSVWGAGSGIPEAYVPGLKLEAPAFKSTDAGTPPSQNQWNQSLWAWGLQVHFCYYSMGDFGGLVTPSNHRDSQAQDERFSRLPKARNIIPSNLRCRAVTLPFATAQNCHCCHLPSC